jgi:hypothetical protein
MSGEANGVETTVTDAISASNDAVRLLHDSQEFSTSALPRLEAAKAALGSFTKDDVEWLVSG